MPKISPTTLSNGLGSSTSLDSQSLENQALASPVFGVCPQNIAVSDQAAVGQSNASLTSGRTSNTNNNAQTSYLEMRDGRFFVSNIPTSKRFTQAVLAKGSVLKTLQVWEGTVTGLGEQNFVATLRDLTKPSNPDEQAEFARVEVSEDDQELLTPGSTFYWVVGTEGTPGGQRKNISTLQFRRLPPWTDNALRRANERAALTRSLFRSGE
jgi:hypothetical protein